MTLFIVGLLVFLISIFTLLTFIGLWTYKDAEVKSTQPPGAWALAAVFIPNAIGFIAYLLIGRTKKDVDPPGTYKKALIASLVVFILSIPLFIIGTVSFATGDFGGGATMNNGVWSVRSTSYRNNVWTETVRSGRGTSRRTHTLNTEQLHHFHVESTNEEGSLFLFLEQGDIVVEIFLSPDYFGPVNLHEHGLEPGRIRMTLQYDRVRNSRTTISWQVP